MELMQQTFNIMTPMHMLHLGGQLGTAFSERLIVLLHGPPGAGKTTFCRGVLYDLGYTGVVRSPTYTLVECYQVGINSIYHFDLYRLNDPEELEYIGNRDYFINPGLYLIEWPDNGQGKLPKEDLNIFFEYDDTQRKVTLIANTKKGIHIIQKIRQ